MLLKKIEKQFGANDCLVGRREIYTELALPVEIVTREKDCPQFFQHDNKVTNTTTAIVYSAKGKPHEQVYYIDKKEEVYLISDSGQTMKVISNPSTKAQPVAA